MSTFINDKHFNIYLRNIIVPAITYAQMTFVLLPFIVTNRKKIDLIFIAARCVQAKLCFSFVLVAFFIMGHITKDAETYFIQIPNIYPIFVIIKPEHIVSFKSYFVDIYLLFR